MITGYTYPGLYVCTISINMRKEQVQSLSSSITLSWSFPSYYIFLIMKIIKFDVGIYFFFFYLIIPFKKAGYEQLLLFLYPQTIINALSSKTKIFRAARHLVSAWVCTYIFLHVAYTLRSLVFYTCLCGRKQEHKCLSDSLYTFVREK